MNSKTHFCWIGGKMHRERDLLVLLESPNLPIQDLAALVRNEVARSLGTQTKEWCGFHWFESQYLINEAYIPIHLFIYGSPYELRSVEHNSIFISFSKKLKIENAPIIVDEPTRQRLADIWRLRSCLVELLLCPPELEHTYRQMASKALQYVRRTYESIIDSNESSNDPLIVGQHALQLLIKTSYANL